MVLPDDCVLLQARGSVFGENVYLCTGGVRHSVRSARRIEQLGFRWPDDVVAVPESVLRAYRSGGMALGDWPANIDDAIIENSLDMREFFAARLRGFGLEVGAGASPFPVPLDCRVLYADKHRLDALRSAMYPGQSLHGLVTPDIIADFDDFRGIADDSLDFIIGCHVIEHTRNPIGAIASAHRKLKAGGKLLLVVPDKERTFDRVRPITALEHMIDDFERPEPGRDYSHYEEYYRLVQLTPAHDLPDTARKHFENASDIHYHVWDYPAFLRMMAYIQENIVSFEITETHPALGDPNHDIEFYALLTK